MSHLRLVTEGDDGWSNPYRVLMCGSRTFDDRIVVETLVQGCLAMATLLGRSLVIAEGEARGADTLARVEAERIGVRVYKYPADWERHGKRAGILRNIEMLEAFGPELVVAFTDDIDQSTGTRHMATIARKAGVPVLVVGRFQGGT